MGLPPYNGGLFDARRAPLLGRIALPDAAFARVPDRLPGVRGDGGPVWFGWRHFARMKDEALTPQGCRLESLPVSPGDSRTASAAIGAVAALQAIWRERQTTQLALRDWLRVTWGLPAPPCSIPSA